MEGEDERQEYEVGNIISMRVLRAGRREYRVRWAQYGHEDDTWEPAGGLPNDFIAEFHEHREKKVDWTLAVRHMREQAAQKLLKCKGAGKLQWEVPMATYPDVVKAVMQWARRPRPYSTFAEEEVEPVDWATPPDAEARTQVMQVRLKGTAALSFFAELQQARPKKVSVSLALPACAHALAAH